MDSGCAAIIGALVGGVMSLLGTGLANWLLGKDARALDEIRKKTLRKRLESSTGTWVTMDDLISHVGGDRDNTVRLLLLIGARRSMKESDKWGFEGWPQPKD